MKKQLAAIFVALAVSAVSLPLWAKNEGPSINTKQVNELLAAGKLQHIKSKADIPKVWWKEMGLDDMSDVGGPFDPGCTGTAPHSRLIAVGISEPYAFLVAERGGVVHWNTLTVFKQENGSVKRVYGEDGLTEARLKELRTKF